MLLVYRLATLLHLSVAAWLIVFIVFFPSAWWQLLLASVMCVALATLFATAAEATARKLDNDRNLL